jgi:hypothetical protein
MTRQLELLQHASPAKRVRVLTPEQRERKVARDKARRAANIDAARKRERDYGNAHSEERKARLKAWAKANPERLKAKEAARRAKKPPRILIVKKPRVRKQKPYDPENARLYYQANRERILKTTAEWRTKNPGKVRGMAAKRYVEKKPAMAAVSAAWAKKNPNKVRSYQIARRARTAGATGKFTGADVSGIFAIQRGNCAHPWCKKKLTNSAYHIDHILPLAKGGSNDRKNIQILCPPCNQKKWAVHPVDFALRNGMLV